MLSDNLDHKYWNIIKVFLKKNYSSKHILLKKKIFDHYFLNKDKTKYNLINYKKENKLLGILGYIPNKFIWENSSNKVNGVWSANWIVDKSHRKGLGVILMRRLQEKYNLIMGIGANEDNKKIIKKMNNEFFESIPRLLIYSDYKKMRHLNLQLPKHEFIVKNYENVLYADKKIIKNRFKPNWNNYSTYKYCTLRSQKYIIERFLEYPFFKYKILIAGNRNPSILVYRVEKIKQIKKKIIRILDLITTTDNDGQINSSEVINFLKKLLFEKDILFADFFCTNKKINNIFKKNGFHMVNKNTINIPIKFNPIVKKDRNQNLEIFFNLKEKFKIDKSYITKSDGDQDRIN